METLAFQVIIRLLSGAGTARQARNRLGEMIAAFGPFGAENTLRPRRIKVNSQGALRAIQRRHWPFFRLNPSPLTLAELTAIYHIPSPTKVRNRYLEVTGARRLPPPAGLPRTAQRPLRPSGTPRPPAIVSYMALICYFRRFRCFDFAAAFSQRN